MGIRAIRPITVAAVTIVAALTGTAVASDPTGTASAVTKKKVKKIAIAQANKQIDLRAPTLSVARAAEADSAERATTADRAASAARATTLAGLGPGQFVRSSRVQFGGPVPGDLVFRARLLSFPHLGLQVRTDGDLDTSPQINVANQNPEGGRRFLITCGVDGTTQSQLGPGANLELDLGPSGSGGGDLFIFDRDRPGGVAFVSCGVSFFDDDAGITSCLGVAS